MSLRDQIQQVDDLQRQPVPTPEWPALDGKLFTRALSGDERDQWETYAASLSEEDPNDENKRRMIPGSRGIRARMVRMGVCDDQGNDVFSEGDEGWLGTKNAAVLDRFDDVIRELSGMGKKPEDAEKNFPSGTSSSSDLPLPSDEPSESCSEA